MAFLEVVAEMWKQIICGVLAVFALAMCTSAQTNSARPGISMQQALALAQKGDCEKALPVLRRGLARIADTKLRLSAAMAQARCGMSLGDYDSSIVGLLQMKRDAPGDPEVLYIWSHYLQQIADRTVEALVKTAPDSVAAQKLNAEAFESQSKWEEASAAYRRILDQDPKAPEIHYRLAHIVLEQSESNVEQARKELAEELKVNPKNAAAEFMLGELARRAGQWDEAIAHFARASQLDAGFLETYLALGMSLNSAGKYAEAIPPLELYVRNQTEDPAGHYQLAMAYLRTGNREGAARESALQRKAAEKTTQNVH